MSSLTTTSCIAVSGLKAQTTNISCISNNLANTSTTAYKTSTTSFDELVTASGSAATGTTGIGVSALTSSNNAAQGTIADASLGTYLALSGNGYFSVKETTTNADGSSGLSSSTYYTRSGDFSLNADGYLENSQGYCLQGWSVDPDTGEIDDSALTSIQVTQLYDDPIATGTVDYVANLPSSVDDGTTTSDSTITIYDSTGAEHTLTYAWTKTDTNIWQLTTTVSDGAYDSATDTTSDYTATVDFTFDTDGNIEYIDSTGNGDYSIADGSVSFNLSFAGADAQAITTDFSEITQTAGTSIEVTSLDQDGVASGSFSSLSIDDSGYVSINYDNGISKIYYQIPVATFASVNNLQALSGNVYQATTTSGTATYSAAGTSGAGTLVTNALESSTTDVATEFTTLIAAQRVYSANAKVLTAVDDMQKTLLEI